jgi:hypothetical protein
MKRIFGQTDIHQTIWGIRMQIQDSLPFARKWCQYTEPRMIWRQLKSVITYNSDPPDIELLQSLPTLLNDNYWGKSGFGDCDCFTIAYTSCCIAKGIPVKIVLCGHRPNEFSHIYNLVQVNGEWVEADLTQPTFASARKYKNYKIISIGT